MEMILDLYCPFEPVCPGNFRHNYLNPKSTYLTVSITLRLMRERETGVIPK